MSAGQRRTSATAQRLRRGAFTENAVVISRAARVSLLRQGELGELSMKVIEYTRMQIERFLIDGTRLERDLLPRLVGEVFHVTTADSFRDICDDGHVRSNQDGRFSFTFPQSRISYARSRGYVSLTDLRDKTAEQIEWSLRKFYFLNPRSNDDPVFLILSAEAAAKVVTPPRTHKEVDYELTWVPETEVCYPADLPIAEVSQVLIPEFFYTPEYLAEQATEAEAAEAIMREIVERRNAEVRGAGPSRGRGKKPK